jgi:hypothetical protein
VIPAFAGNPKDQNSKSGPAVFGVFLFFGFYMAFGLLAFGILGL